MFLLVTLLLIRYEGYLLYQWSACYSLGKFFVLLGVLWKRDQGRDWDFPAIVVRVVERSERDMHILSILCLRSWEHILGHLMPTWLREASRRPEATPSSLAWILTSGESPDFGVSLAPLGLYLCFLLLPEFIVFSDLGLDLILESPLENSEF